MEDNKQQKEYATEMVSEEQLQKDIAIVGKLEDFCTSGEFTQLMSEFGETHASKFEDSEEQSLECYALYQEYCKILEHKLEEFLSKEGISSEQMYKSCMRVQQMDSQSLMCIDWLLASCEYIEFVSMMLQFKEAREWNDDEEQQQEIGENQ